MNTEDQYAQARKFLDALKPPFALVHDKDADGICSAVIILKYLKQRGVQADFVSPVDGKGREVASHTVAELNKRQTLITCDLPVHGAQFVKDLRMSSILYLDHHPPSQNLARSGVLHINPHFSSRVYHPTSYMAFRITRSPEMEKYAWIAAVGTVADYGAEDCKDVLDLVAQQHPNLVLDGKDRYVPGKMLNSSGLGMFAGLIEAKKAMHDLRGVRDAFDIFMKAEEPDDIMRSSLMNDYDKFKKEQERLLRDFEDKAHFYPHANAYVYIVDSKFEIVSNLATHAGELFPDSVVLVIGKDEKEGVASVSARCQTGRIDVGQLIIEFTKGIGTGGGHAKAAGAGVPLDRFDEFMERLTRKFEGL